MTLDEYKPPDTGVDFRGKHPRPRRPPQKGNNRPLTRFYTATLSKIPALLWPALSPAYTAQDTCWIAVLYKVAPEAEPKTVTAGWLRASMSRANEAESTPSARVVYCREPKAIPVRDRLRYRLPLVANACRLPARQRLRLVLA